MRIDESIYDLMGPCDLLMECLQASTRSVLVARDLYELLHSRCYAGKDSKQESE